MAEIVCSAVAGEAARKLSLCLSGEDADCESNEDKVERLELAVIKLQTIVAVSEDWQITHPPLLNWKAKIKRVSKEGKGLLRAHKKQLLKHKRSNTINSIRQHMVRVAKLFMPFSYGAEDLSVTTVRRFERLAGGADDFLKFVKCSGRPKSLMFLPALVRSLCAGEAMELSLRMASGTAVILLQPWWLEEEEEEGNARKACLWMSYEDDMALQKNFKMITVFHLSDSVDITQIVMNCAEQLPPQFWAVRVAMKELLSEIVFYGRKPAAPSVLYMRFVRFIQNSHRYGFEPTRHNKRSSGRLQLQDPILLACAHCYILPAEKSNRAPLELVWHTSPCYLPKKLSEQHEKMEPPQMVGELLPRVTNGFYCEEGVFDHGKQWWCPQSSTRLSMTPVLSPPTTLQKWCSRQKQERSTHGSSK